MPPMMINLAEAFEKPKYIVSIRQAHNGFAIEIEQEVIRKGPMSPIEAQRKISNFMNGVQNQMENGPTDSKLRDIYAKAGITPGSEEEEDAGPQIIGLHVFQTYPEMAAFLSFVYEINNEEPKKKIKKK